MVHGCLEGGRCIRETEWHNEEFVVAIIGAEGGSLDSLFGKVNLIKAGSEINFGVEIETAKLIEEFINSGYGKTILNCDIVEGAVVYTKPPRVFFFS